MWDVIILMINTPYLILDIIFAAVQIVIAPESSELSADSFTMTEGGKIFPTVGNKVMEFERPIIPKHPKSPMERYVTGYLRSWHVSCGYVAHEHFLERHSGKHGTSKNQLSVRYFQDSFACAVFDSFF